MKKIILLLPIFFLLNSLQQSRAQAAGDFQSAGSGKPENIIAKMTEGRLKKFLADVSLLEQPHMIEEGNPKVKEVASKLAKDKKCKVDIIGFARIKVGETDDLSTSAS